MDSGQSGTFGQCNDCWNPNVGPATFTLTSHLDSIGWYAPDGETGDTSDSGDSGGWSGGQTSMTVHTCHSPTLGGIVHVRSGGMYGGTTYLYSCTTGELIGTHHVTDGNMYCGGYTIYRGIEVCDCGPLVEQPWGAAF